MGKLNISCEQFQQALAWLGGEPSTLGEKEVLGMLRTLTEAFRANCRVLRDGPVPLFRGLVSRPSPLSISAIMEETQRRLESSREPDRKAEAEEAPSEALRALLADDDDEVVPTIRSKPVSTPSEEPKVESRTLDSVLLINSIAHVGVTAGYPITQSRAQIILYCLYGTRLASGQGRLEIEHPQMWKYGPVFPRAYKRGALEDRSACAQAYRELLEREPDLVGPLSTKTQAMMATPMADLNAVHKGAQSPYGKILSQNPDKWGTLIPDEVIAEFFRRRMAG